MARIIHPAIALLCATCLGPLAANAQILERQLVGSTGNTATSTNYILDFSVGDLVVNTSSSTSFTLTQGYQQNADFSTSVVASDDAPFNISVFPNPTRNAVTLQWGALPAAPYTVSVFNMLGEMVHSEAGLTTTTHLLDFNDLSAGMYSLHVIVDGGTPITMRVQKVG